MSKPLQKSLIVVIDDDEAARTSLAQLLTLRRFDVRTFHQVRPRWLGQTSQIATLLFLISRCLE